MRHRFVILLCLFVLGLPAVGCADSSPTIDDFVGTDLHYRIAFLWMDHVADGEFLLERGAEPGVYRARLVGKTRGFSAWLTNDRLQSYETRMRLLPDGHLQTLTHESLIDKGRGKKRKQRSKFYQFDPAQHRVVVEKHGNGQLMWHKEIEVGDEPFPVDVLTAFFNFATGVYGPFERGRRYEVPAFSGKGVGKIVIEVVPGKEAPGSLFDDDQLVCKVQVDQDVFDTSDGVLYVQFDAMMRPQKGVIKDIIGLGDIRGELR